MIPTRVVAADARAFRRAVRAGRPYRPLDVKIKVVWTCNLRCGMCPHWREPGDRPLEAAAFLALVDDLAALGTRRIHLSGGEPTLRPDLEAIVARAAGHGLRVAMTTNATRLDAARAGALVAAGLRQANVSFDGPDAAVHDAIRGVPGAFERARAGFAHLRAALPAGRLRVNTVVSQANWEAMPAMAAFVRAIGADRWNLMPMDEAFPELRRLGGPEIAAWNARIGPAVWAAVRGTGLFASEAEAYPFGRRGAAVALAAEGGYARGFYARRGCLAPFTHAFVDHVGRVSVCCMLPNAPVLGDLRSSSFKEIWEGAAYAAVRRLDQAPAAACATCDHFLAANRELLPLTAAGPVGACRAAWSELARR
jgi:MoaA/NifB/PqqE/SkfB family radical SAM enzyme